MKPDPLAVFDQLAARAAQEMSPHIDVADRVLAALHAPVRRDSDSDSASALFGVSSIVAACAAAVMFIVSTGNDSLVMLAKPFFTVLP